MICVRQTRDGKNVEVILKNVGSRVKGNRFLAIIINRKELVANGEVGKRQVEEYVNGELLPALYAEPKGTLVITNYDGDKCISVEESYGHDLLTYEELE